MKMTRFKPFSFSRMDAHAAWLTDMARQGLRYMGQNSLGFQRFEHAEPAEMAFSWDLAPRKEDELLAYRRQCRAAGWELAGTVGHWHCWRQPAVAGQAVQPLRDLDGMRTMLRELQRRFASAMMLTVVSLCMLIPSISRPGGPRWLTVGVYLGLLVLTGILAPNALHAKARLRQLDANGPG